MKPFRQAIEARDLGRATGLLADDVVFNSPVAHKAYRGRETVGFILATVAQVFEDFRYIDELEHDGHSMLRFTARVGDRSVEGVDLIEVDAAGKIAALTVMVRPLSGLQALAAAMGARLQPK